jgi:membrane protein implicated in regulation of membrane protease activity
MTGGQQVLGVREPAVPDVGPGDIAAWIAEYLGFGWGSVLGLALPTLLVVMAGTAVTVWLWRRTRLTPSTTTGADLFPGRVVTVTTAEGSRGQAFVEGSWWAIRSTDAPLQVGQDVRVREVDGLVLLVEDPRATKDGEDIS